MYTWVNYYGADAYLVGDPDEHFFDFDQHNFAAALGIDPLDLYHAGFGTNWQQVESLGLDTMFQWFAQGDPWNALIGVGDDSIRVVGLNMTIGGLAGPGTLADRDPNFFHERSDLTGLLQSLKTVRNAMQRRWRRCRDCQSPRLGGDCTCHGSVLGIIYD
jgi:hypothetical protein